MTQTLPTGRLKMRVLAKADTVAHWRFEEASGGVVVDEAGQSDLATAASIVSSGPHLGEAQNKGRAFSGGVTATGASSPTQLTQMLGPCTIEARFRLNTIATAQTIVCLGAGGTDATGANNTLGQLSVRAGGTPSFVWEQGSGVNVVSNFTVAISAGVDVTVAVRRRLTSGGTYDVDLAIDGIIVETLTGRGAPSGGSSATWMVGNQLDSGLGGGNLDGTLWEVRIAAVALSDEALRDSHARAVRDWDLARVIASGVQQVQTRALIRDGDGTWKDLSDVYDVNFVDGFEDSDDVDADGGSGRLMLRRRQAWLSIAPFMSSSRPNAFDPDGQLLDVARRIKLEEAYLPHGASRAAVAGVHWQLVFDGYARVVADDGAAVTLTLSGRERALQAAWCQPNRAPNPDEDFRYGASATPIETVLAQVLSDHAPTSIGGTVEGYAGGDDFTIWVPDSPLFTIDNSETTTGSSAGFTVPSSKSVFQALTDIVDATIAWFFRFTFDEARQEFRLALLDPGRARVWSSAADRTLTASSIKRWRKLEVNDDAIRNDVEVEYGNTSTKDNVSVNKRAVVRVEDATSVARWWRRYCRIGLDSAGQLNTTAQATDLANRMLSDLAQPLADAEVELPPRRDIGVSDIVRIAGDGVRHPTGFNFDFAVVAVRHTRRRGERVTVLTLRRSKPAGRVRRWMERMQQRGVNKALGLTPPPTPAAPTLVAIAGGLWVEWTMPVNYGGRRYRETEIHVGSTAGFTPSSSTLKSIVRGKNAAALEIDPTTTAYVKLVHRDDMRNASAAGAAASSTPRFLPKAPYVSATRTTSNQSFNPPTVTTIVFNAETGDPFGNYNVSTGEWTQTKAGVVWIQASARYDSNAKPSSQASLKLYVNGAEVRSGPTATTNAGAAPNRATVELPQQVLVLAAGDVVTVRIAADGNASSSVLNDALSWLVISTGPHL